MSCDENIASGSILQPGDKTPQHKNHRRSMRAILYEARRLDARSAGHRIDPRKYDHYSPDRVVRVSKERGDVSLPRVKFIERGDAS
jgi:hypothetical protein